MSDLVNGQGLPSTSRARSLLGAGLRWVLKPAFVAGVVYYLIVHAPIRRILDALIGVNLWYFGLALAVVPLSAWVIAARQKILTDWQGLTLSVRQIMEINLVTRFYDLVLPAYLSGPAVRWPRMARPDGKPVEALAAIVFNRSAEILTTLVLALVFWFVGRPAGLNSPWATLVLVLVLGAAILAQLALFRARVADWFCARLETGFLRRLPARLRNRAAGLAQATGLFQGMPASVLFRLAALSLVRGLTIVASFAFLAWALHIEITFGAAGWVRSMLKIAAILPFSVMGIGVREVGVVILLQFYDVPEADAVALSLLLVGRNLAKAIAGGMMEARHSLASKGLAARIPR